MKRQALLLTAACLSTTSLLPAQTTKARRLIFTTMGREFTRYTTPPTSLERITPEDVMVVTRRGNVPYTSAKFVPRKAWLIILGDQDNDARYWEAALAGKIDAVHTHRALLETRLVDELPFAAIATSLGYTSAETARQSCLEARAKLLVKLRARGVKPGGLSA